MESTTRTRTDCGTCPGRMVCHCLQVTEEMLLDALRTFELRSVKDIRCQTGAGDGCTACHRRLKRYLEEKAAPTVSQAAC